MRQLSLLLKTLHSSGGDGHGHLLFQYNVVRAITQGVQRGWAQLSGAAHA